MEQTSLKVMTNLADTLARERDNLKLECERKDTIIDHIRASELRLIADLEKANARVDEVEMQNTKLRLDEVMAGWALHATEKQLQRALGWIDHADRAPLGLSSVNPAPTEEETADEN